MNEETHSIAKEDQEVSTTERFNELYANGKLRELTYEEVPAALMEKFESWAQLYISRDKYIPQNFTGLYVLLHENGDQTYVAELERRYSDNNETGEPVVFIESKFIEMRGDTEIGHGEIRRDISQRPVHEGAPYIGFTGTEKNEEMNFERQGLGRRRAETMNTFTQARYGMPLFSGTTVSPQAHGMFRKMVAEGRAEQITDDSTKPPTVSYRMPKIIPGEK